MKPICPTRIPRSNYARLTDVSTCSGGRGDCLVRGVSIFSLQHGGENSHDPRQNRPPALVHLVLYTGRLGGRLGYQQGGSSAFPFDWPSPEDSFSVDDELIKTDRERAVSLGRVKWGNHEGQLVLAPSSGGLLADHLLLRFETQERGHLVSLHAWEPVREAVATLRAIVLSTPAMSG